MNDIPNDIDELHDDLVDLLYQLNDISAAQQQGAATVASEGLQQAKNELTRIINTFHEEETDNGDEDDA